MGTVVGLCDRDGPHKAHTFPSEYGGLWDCPGQYSECRNCDDRKCVGCVFREYDHDCVDDCPFCCSDIQQ